MKINANPRLVSFFGPDGIGKTSFVESVAHELGPEALVFHGTKPATWPKGEAIAVSIAEKDACIRSLEDGDRKQFLRDAFSNFVTAESYKIANGLTTNHVVLNDSDVLLKTLSWAAVEKRSVSARMAQLVAGMQSTGEAALPGSIFYIHVDGNVTEQSEVIFNRLNGREHRSPSDPITLNEVTNRLAASEILFSELIGLQATYGYALHSAANPSDTAAVKAAVKSVAEIIRTTAL